MLRNKHTLYNNTHKVDVTHRNGLNAEKNIFVQVFEYNNILEIKLRDINEYSFNYTTRIDWSAFEKIKNEQCLEISYDEFKMQIIELLRQTLSKEMLVKMDANDDTCRIVFYEKSRIKSLIFLTLDLQLTNQKEIIDEMGNSLMQMKEANKNLSSQLAMCRSEINEKDISLRNARKINFELEKQFCKDLQMVEQSFMKSISNVEKKLSDNLQKINLRHLKLICDLERVKSDNKLKGESSTRLVQSLQNMRLENDKHYQTIRNLQMEVDNLSMLRTKTEKTCCELRQIIGRKDADIVDLQKQVAELRKDIQEATKIIAQKTKTHDELAKDLVQANTMIVSFNNHCDTLSNEIDKMKTSLGSKEKIIEDQQEELVRISEEFSKYRSEFKAEEVKTLRHELLFSRQKIEELEKQNREAAKLNGILTKKLASGDLFENTRTMNWSQQK